MTDERYFFLESASPNAKLTEEEARLGWHWCADWDFLLIGPGFTSELEGCSCPEGKWARQGGS